MTKLREAREKGNLEAFIKEREGQTGDAAAVDRTIGSMAGKPDRKPVEKQNEQ